MDNTRARIISTLVYAGILPAAAGFFVSLILPSAKWIQVPLHSAIEAIGFFVGISLAMLLLIKMKRAAEASHYTYVASALLGMGILDGFHSVVPPGNLFVWLHTMAIFTGGVFFALVWVSGRKAPGMEAKIIPWVAAIAAASLGTLSILYSELLPKMISEGGFTRAAISLNILGGVFFVLAAIHFLVHYRTNKALEEIYFACFCLLNGSSGILFEASQPWLADWWFWHLLRMGGYIALILLVFGIHILIEQISEAVNVLEPAVVQLLTLTTQLASTSAETAAAVNETTTTVEEVRLAANMSSEKAKGVLGSTQGVVQVAQAGKKAVDEVAEGMQRIRQEMESIAKTIVFLSDQNQSIGGIIATVTDLADQSNLLAVNAAIEAAKAGDQGRGFAVVAQEIKSLAEQSKQATTQVRNILGDIQKATSAAVMATEQGGKAVDTGMKQSAQARDSIKALADSTAEAAEAATQIVASGQQQVVGMDQVGLAMENINQASVETVTAMKQVEIAAQNLNELGQRLRRLVGGSTADNR